MQRAVALLAALLLVPALLLTARVAAQTHTPDPVELLTEQDRALWATNPSDRGEIPVLAYHGIDSRDGFSSDADAFYGVTPTNFAKQMGLLDHAGYEAITLEQFERFHGGEPVDLPAHPVLITFDDGRADTGHNAAPILSKLDWPATVFIDVGAIDAANPEYASWDEVAAMQRSGRWSVQLHAGHGHHSIRYGSGEREVGPFYAYRDADGETLEQFAARVRKDLEWGEQQLREHVPGFEPIAFAPPYGAYGQLGSNDPELPARMDRLLHERFPLIFTQVDPRAARPGDHDVPRFQVDRLITGGALRDWLANA